jgi:PAS domain S-box-containing protein
MNMADKETKELLKKELQGVKEDLDDLETYTKEFYSFLPLAICTVNPQRIIIDINQSFQDLTDYDFFTLIGEPLEKIFLEKKDIYQLVEESRTKKITKFGEFTLISKIGKEIPVSVSVSVRKDRDDNLIGYFLAINDITGEKKSREDMEAKVKERTNELEESRVALMNILEDVADAQKAAEEERNKIRAIISNLSDGLLVFNKENKITLVNPQVEKYFEIKEEELLGKNISEISQTPFLFALNEIFGGEIKETFRKELSLKENLILEISSAPILKQKESVGFLIICHDITREKNIERMKSEFVSVSAHQLRTPLSAIKWTLRAILDGDMGNLSQEQNELLQKTYVSNERMIALVNDLLDVSRIEDGRNVYKPSLGDLEQLIKYFIDSYKNEAERKGVKLEFKKENRKVPKIMFDAEKMKLVVQNLIENAIRYTSQNGKVTVSLKNDKKEVEISVHDTGVGIPQNQQQRVFSKFFRAQNVIRMETEGTGLGLFISKNIVEAHGGRIWFESEEGKGTTFNVALPIGEEFEEFLKEF